MLSMKKTLIIFGIIVSLLVFGGCAKDESDIKATAITLETSGEEQFVEAYGVVVAAEVENIVVDSPASVEMVNVKEGQRVKKGEALIKFKQDSSKPKPIVSDMTNGLVYNLSCIKGDFVSSGQQVASIANMDNLIINANVEQGFIDMIKIGSKVEIKPEFNKAINYKGKISFISSKAVQKNGETTIPIEVTFNDKVEELILSSEVQLKIHIEDKK